MSVRDVLWHEKSSHRVANHRPDSRQLNAAYTAQHNTPLRRKRTRKGILKGILAFNTGPEQERPQLKLQKMRVGAFFSARKLPFLSQPISLFF